MKIMLCPPLSWVCSSARTLRQPLATRSPAPVKSLSSRLVAFPIAGVRRGAPELPDVHRLANWLLQHAQGLCLTGADGEPCRTFGFLAGWEVAPGNQPTVFRKRWSRGRWTRVRLTTVRNDRSG